MGGISASLCCGSQPPGAPFRGQPGVQVVVSLEATVQTRLGQAPASLPFPASPAPVRAATHLPSLAGKLWAFSAPRAHRPPGTTRFPCSSDYPPACVRARSQHAVLPVAPGSIVDR